MGLLTQTLKQKRKEIEKNPELRNKDYEIDEIMGLAAGGFDGATRLTRTNPEMIIDMYNTNSENINKFLFH